jgi:hypothetical protein
MFLAPVRWFGYFSFIVMLIDNPPVNSNNDGSKSLGSVGDVITTRDKSNVNSSPAGFTTANLARPVELDTS